MPSTNTNTNLYGIKSFAGISEMPPLPVHHPQCTLQSPCAICEVTAMPSSERWLNADLIAAHTWLWLLGSSCSPQSRDALSPLNQMFLSLFDITRLTLWAMSSNLCINFSKAARVNVKILSPNTNIIVQYRSTYLYSLLVRTVHNYHTVLRSKSFRPVHPISQITVFVKYVSGASTSRSSIKFIFID